MYGLHHAQTEERPESKRNALALRLSENVKRICERDYDCFFVVRGERARVEIEIIICYHHLAVKVSEEFYKYLKRKKRQFIMLR